MDKVPCAAVYNSTDEERTIHLDFADFYLRGDVECRPDLFEKERSAESTRIGIFP